MSSSPAVYVAVIEAIAALASIVGCVVGFVALWLAVAAKGRGHSK